MKQTKSKHAHRLSPSLLNRDKNVGCSPNVGSKKRICKPILSSNIGSNEERKVVIYSRLLPHTLAPFIIPCLLNQILYSYASCLKFKVDLQNIYAVGTN